MENIFNLTYKEVKIISESIGYNEKLPICYKEPNQCPICKISLKPFELFSSINVRNEKDISLLITYLCTACDNIFISKYISNSSGLRTYKNNNYFNMNHEYSAPDKFEDRKFDNEIMNLSENFVTIYNQSLQAEFSGLNEIAGMGYRKAVEFLIKDYVIKYNFEDKTKIESMPLNNCIADYIKDVHINTLAKRCIWIGNDETHYVRKHIDLNISDLKVFIDAMLHWIIMEEIYNKAENINPIK